MVQATIHGINMSTTSLPPPSFYEDKISYAYEWAQYRDALRSKVESVTIFDLAFVSTEILVAGTSAGELCFFQLPPIIDEDSDVDNGISTESLVKAGKQCLHRIQVTSGAIYSINVNSDSNNNWLIVGGDGGVWLFDSNQIKSALDSKSSLQPKHHFMLHPSPHETAVEVNDTCFQQGTLWGAAGDDFGCYKWDTETGKLVKTYQSKRGFLQTIELVPNTNILLTGGEEGTLGMWDIQQDCLIDQLQILDQSTCNAETIRQPPLLTSNNTRISSIIARDENWWTIGGERQVNKFTTRHHTTPEKNGFIATIHGPTRSVISQIELRETPQKLAFVRDGAIVSVANESYMTYFKNPLSLENPERVWCHTPSAFAATTSQNGILAVAGVGGSIDLYRNQTQLIGTLRL